MIALSDSENLLDVILRNLENLLLALVSVGLIALTIVHIKEYVADKLVKRFRRKKFRLRTTIVKDMLGKTTTQTTKLRRIRAVEALNELILDPWPHMVDENGQERLAQVPNFYCIPGFAARHESNDLLETKFRMIYDDDHKLKPHREYSTLMAYTLEESIEATLLPPFFGAIQPVGKESFAYEVHFPEDKRYIRDGANPNNKEYPLIKVYRGEAPPKPGRLIRYEQNGLRKWRQALGIIVHGSRARYHVTGGRRDFRDGHDLHDWFRVTVCRPPQKEEITICWCMEGDTTPRAWCPEITIKAHESNH